MSKQRGNGSNHSKSSQLAGSSKPCSKTLLFAFRWNIFWRKVVQACSIFASFCWFLFGGAVCSVLFLAAFCLASAFFLARISAGLPFFLRWLFCNKTRRHLWWSLIQFCSAICGSIICRPPSACEFFFAKSMGGNVSCKSGGNFCSPVLSAFSVHFLHWFRRCLHFLFDAVCRISLQNAGFAVFAKRRALRPSSVTFRNRNAHFAAIKSAFTVVFDYLV